MNLFAYISPTHTPVLISILNIYGMHSLSLAMAAFQVPVTKCELWAVTTAFGKNGVGQVQ